MQRLIQRVHNAARTDQRETMTQVLDLTANVGQMRARQDVLINELRELKFRFLQPCVLSVLPFRLWTILR